MSEKEFEADDLEQKDYSYNPKSINVNGIEVTDYTDIEHNRIFLVNRNNILTKPRPSWIPDIDMVCLERDSFLPVCVRDSDGNYFVQKSVLDIPEEKDASKLTAKEKFTKYRKNTYYKMTLDLLAATVDYYIKLKRAELKSKNDTHKVGLPRAMNSMSWERFDGMVSMFNLCEKYKDNEEIKKKYPRNIKKRSPLYDVYTRQTNTAFKDHYQPLLSELRDKKLDMNLQKQDAIDTHKKGEETSYGKTGRSNTLLDKYGFTIKKQNGKSFTSDQIKELDKVTESVWNYFGNLTELSSEYGLCISVATNTHQHARKAVGIFNPEYNAIGISFFDMTVQDSKEADMVFAHEVTHWLDYKKGEELHYNYASDKSGTLENEIALKFKNLVRSRNSGSGKPLGEYWNRTCECLARAVEEDYALKHDIHTLDRDMAYVQPEKFIKEIQPLVEKLLNENRLYFSLNEIEPMEQKMKIEKENTKTVYDNYNAASDILKKYNLYDGAEVLYKGRKGVVTICSDADANAYGNIDFKSTEKDSEGNFINIQWQFFDKEDLPKDLSEMKLLKKEIDVSEGNKISNDIPFFKINEPKLKQLVSSLKKTETEIADAEKTKPDTFNYLRGANKSMDNKIYTYQEKIAKLSNRKKVIETRIKIEAKFPLSVTDWDNLERMCIKPVDKESISLLDKNSFEYYAAVINSSLENTGFSAMKEIPLVIENTSGILFNTLLVNKDGSVELKQADRNFIEKDEYNFIKSRNEENVNKIKNSFNPVIIWDCIRSPFDSTSFHIPFEASLIKEEGGIVTYEYQTLYPPRDSALWNYGAPLDSPVTVQDETKIENVYHNFEEIKKVLKNRTLKDIKGFMGQMVNFQGLDEYKLLSELEKTKAFEELFPIIDLHEVWKEINKDVNFDNPTDSDLVRWVSQYFTQQKKLLDLEKENEKTNRYALITDEKTGEITEISQEEAFNHEKGTGLIGYPGTVRTFENGKYVLGFPEFFLIGEGGTYDFEDVLYSTYPSNASGLDKECYRRLGELFKSHFSPFLPYLADGISKYDRGDELGKLLLQLPEIYYEHPEEKKEFHKKIMNILNSKEVKIPYEQAVLNFEKENKDILDAIIIKNSSQQSLRDFSQHVKNGDYGDTLKHKLEENCKACGFPAESIITGVYRDYELNFNGEYIGDGKKPSNIRLGENDMSKNIQKEEIKQQELDYDTIEPNSVIMPVSEKNMNIEEKILSVTEEEIKQERKVYEDKIKHLKEELESYKKEDPSGKAYEFEISDIERNIKNFENISDEVISENLLQRKKQQLEIENQTFDHYLELKEKKEKENTAQTNGLLFAENELTPVIEVRNKTTSVKDWIEPSYSNEVNVMYFGNLDSETAAKEVIKKINDSGFNIVSNPRKLIIYNDEKFYSFNVHHSNSKYDKSELTENDFIKFISEDFKVTRRMKNFEKIEKNPELSPLSDFSFKEAEQICQGMWEAEDKILLNEYKEQFPSKQNMPPVYLGEAWVSAVIAKHREEYKDYDFTALLNKDFSLDSEKSTADSITKDSKILDWYKKTYPSDTEMFEDIYPEATFAAFEKAIEEDRYQFNPRYDYGDSVVRERIFQKISELNGEDYNVIYNKWVSLPELREPHYIRDFDGTLIKFAEPEEQLRLNAEDILYMLQNNYMDSENNEPLLTVEKAREYVMEQIYDYWTDGHGNSSSKDGICSYLRALGNYNELRIIDDAILKTCTNPSYLLPGELQRLKDMDAILKDESIIKVYSYNKIEFWNDRSKAESFYRTAMLATDGSESDRYKNIYADLSSGNMLCCDEQLPYAGYADYVAREECKPSICDYDKDYVLVRQPYSEVVDSLSPENISVSDNNKSKNINKYEASPFYTNRVDLKKSLYEQRRAFLEVKWTERSGLEYLPEGLVWPLCEADVNFRTVNDEFKDCIKAEFTLVYPSEGEEYSDKNRNTYSFGEDLGTGHKLESLSDRIRNMCSYPDKVFPDFEKAFLKEYGTEQMLSKDKINKINDILLPLKKEYLEALKPLREKLKETEESVRKIKNQTIIDSSSYESAETSLEESKKAVTDLFLSFAAKCVYAEQREVLSGVKQNAYDAALFYANHAVKNVLIDSFSEESRAADYDEIDWNEWHSFISCLPDIADFDSILNKSHELYRSVINKECRIDFSNVKVLADSPNRRGFEFDINVPEKTALVFGIEEPFTLHGIQKGQNVQMSLPKGITGKYKVNEKEIKVFYDTVNKDVRSLDLSKYILQQTVEKTQEEIKNEINTAFKETELGINSSESNQAFVLDGASNGMLSKYIGTGDIERIDEFREFAAKNIEGTASDKSYFAQMWLYGKIFHFDRNIHTEKEFYHYDYPEEKKLIVDEVNEYFKNSNASPKYILCCGGWDARDGMARPWSYFIGNNRELLIQKARTMISEKAVEFVYLHNTPEWFEDQSKNTLYRIEFNQKLSSGYKLGIISEDDYENKKVTHYKNIKELKDVIRENEKDIPGLSSDAVILKNYGYLSDFNRNVKLVGEKDIKGEPWEKWNTNPEVFLHFYNPKNDKGTVLYIRKDLADIINRHNETSTLEWEDNIAEEIIKLFPEISESYIKTSISPLRMGFRNGSKLNLLVSDTTPEIIQSMIAEKEIENKNKKTEVNDMSKVNQKKTPYEELTPEKFMNFYNDEINENRDVKMDERAAKAVLDSCANEFGLKLSDNKIVSVNDTYPAGQSISASEILRASVIGREDKAAYHLDPKVSVIFESRGITGNAKERLFERYHERLKKLFAKQSNNPQFGFSGINNYEEAKAVSDLYKWARKNHPYCFDRNIATEENYMDTSVIEEYLVKKGIELNEFKKTAVSEQKYTFFVKDTAEFDQFADFEPFTNLTAEEAVKKYSELREKGMNCGIGLHIPGDFIFDDPSGNGITLVINRDDRAVFDVMGDTFIKELNDRQIKDGSARTYIDAYKELYEAFEKNSVAVKKPQFVFDKESELYSETEHKTSVVISPVKLSDILGVMDMRPDLSNDGKLKVWDIQREEYIDNGNEEYIFESAADIFERLDSYISDYFIDDMVEQPNDAGVGPASSETLEELCRIYKNELEKGNDKLDIDELNLAEGIVNPDTVIIDIKPEISVENKKELTFNYFVRSTSLDSNDKNWFEPVRNLTAEEAAKMMIEKFKEGFIPGIGINIPGHPSLDDSASSLPVIESNKDGFWDFTEKAHEVIENAGSFAPVLIDAFEELYVGVKKTVDVMSHETDFIENKKKELGIETKWVFIDSALGTDWSGKGYIGPDYDIFTVRQNDKTFVCAGISENYLNAKGIYDNSDKSFIELCELKPEYGNGLFYRFAHPFGNLNFPVDKLSEEENRVFEDALKEHFPLLWNLYEKHTQQLEDKRETINSSFPVQNGKFFHIIEMIDDIKGFAEGISDHIRTKEDFEKTWNLHVADDAQLIRFGDYLENALYDASLASEKGLVETAALASYAFNLKPEDYKISDTIGFIKSREEAVKKAFGELIPGIADVPVSMNGKYMEFIVERTNNNLLPGGVIRVLNADYADHKLRCTYVDPHNNKLDLSVPENIEILKDWLTSEDLAYYNIWGRKEIVSDNHKEKHFIRSLHEACENAQTIISVNGEKGISTHKLPDVYRSIGIEEKPLYVPYRVFNSMAESGVDSKDMFNIISGIFDPTLITEFEGYARKPCSRHDSLCVIPNILTKNHEPVGIHVVEKEGCLEVEAVSKLSSTYIQDKINNKLLVYYDDCPDNNIQNVDFTIPAYLMKPHGAENQESINNDRFRLKSQNMVFENLQVTLESKDAGLKAIMRNDEGYTSEFYVYGKDESKPLTRGSIYRDGKLWLSDPMSGHLIEHVNNQPNLEAVCKNIADYQDTLERKSHSASQSYTKNHDGEKPFTLSVSPDKTKLCLNLEGTPNFAVRERLTECGFSYSTITRQWKAAMNPENLSKFVSTVETLWPDMNDYVKANLAELSVSSETKQREKKCPIDFSKIENTGANLAENLRTISRDYPEYNGNLTHILSDLFVNAKPQDKQEILAVFKGCSGSDELNVMLKDFAENKNTPKLEKQEEIGPER